MCYCTFLSVRIKHIQNKNTYMLILGLEPMYFDSKQYGCDVLTVLAKPTTCNTSPIVLSIYRSTASYPYAWEN
jgi:hypothetical protein